MKKVYACFTTDVIHDGHLNIINKAKEYGEVIIGVLSDEAMVKFDRFPAIPFEERMELIKSTPGVDRVIKQDDIMYDKV
ncbi:MAG: adenylyltransferase/cytidyltransferase family protein, partial [Ruminococcaceae bacterium]|nr:adenylyltransferase/cytidyltransferase family protein [Oscillospiraceae bacterium]